MSRDTRVYKAVLAKADMIERPGGGRRNGSGSEAPNWCGIRAVVTLRRARRSTDVGLGRTRAIGKMEGWLFSGSGWIFSPPMDSCDAANWFVFFCDSWRGSFALKQKINSRTDKSHALQHWSLARLARQSCVSSRLCTISVGPPPPKSNPLDQSKLRGNSESPFVVLPSRGMSD